MTTFDEPSTTHRIATPIARAEELTETYWRAIPMESLNVTVITARDEIDARAAELQVKLLGLGITDLSAEGSLVLSGLTEITPGARRGVQLGAVTFDTDQSITFDTLPGYFTYTNAGRMAASKVLAVDAATSTTAVGAAGTDRSARRRGARVETDGAVGGATTTNGPPLNAGRTLVMHPSSVLLADEAIIAVDELQLQDGTELLIANEVKYLTILANRITVGDGASVTWEARLQPDRLPSGDQPTSGSSHARTAPCDHSWFYATDGGAGGDGRKGDQGFFGDDAPTVEIWTIDAVALPAFELNGGHGGKGQPGGPGGNGGHGAKGMNSHGTLMGCAETAGWGGDGGDGGAGGGGGRGGRGGQGGRVLLYLTDPVHEAVLASGLTLHLDGGVGGLGAAGGRGGQRGLGGEAGDPKGTWCSAKPERAGQNGSDGTDGETGKNGRIGPLYSDGDVPNLTAIVITVDDFLVKLTAPQIRTVTPFQAEVGDVVTIVGANYASTAIVSIGGIASTTTFRSDTTLLATVPAISSGWHEVLVEIPGGQTSNPASVEVLPSLFAATPNPASLGMQVTLTGSGFDPDCRVHFRGRELSPDSVSTDGTVVMRNSSNTSGPS